MRARKPFRSQWIHRNEPKPERFAKQIVDVRAQKAKHLPMPGPGIVVTVPLHLLPDYLELYHLVPLTRGEVVDREATSKQRKPAGMLWVKRVHS